MKSLIEGMINIIFVTIFSIMMFSLILVESSIIQNRNDFYNAYEETMINEGSGIYVESKPISIELPFIGKVVDSYRFGAYTK